MKTIVPYAITCLACAALLRPAVAKANRERADVGRVYQIPYRLTETKHILVRARVNGKGPYNFLVDTGAPDLFMASEKAKEAGCAPDAQHRARFKTFEIEGGPVLTAVGARVEEVFQLRSMNAIDAAGARIDGVMGYTVLARFRVEIDLNSEHMRWTRLDYTPAPPQGMLELTGGKVPASAKDAKNMEQLARFASSLFQRQPSKPPVARGFIGIELSAAEASPTVVRTFPNGPADRGGVKARDRILSVAVEDKPAQSTSSVSQLRNATAGVRSGDKLTITVDRSGQRKQLKLVAGAGAL